MYIYIFVVQISFSILAYNTIQRFQKKKKILKFCFLLSQSVRVTHTPADPESDLAWGPCQQSG